MRGEGSMQKASQLLFGLYLWCDLMGLVEACTSVAVPQLPFVSQLELSLQPSLAFIKEICMELLFRPSHIIGVKSGKTVLNAQLSGF